MWSSLNVLSKGCILEDINIMLFRGNDRNVLVRQIGIPSLRFVVGPRNLNLCDFSTFTLIYEVGKREVGQGRWQRAVVLSLGCSLESSRELLKNTLGPSSLV